MDCENKITIKGFVFIDENGDGQWVYTEKGIKNTSVDLIKDDKVVLTYQTKDTGEYVFEVCPANYIIKANYTQGDDSYIERDTLMASTSANDYNFKVVKDNSLNYNDYIWIVIGLLGFILLSGFSFLLRKMRRSNGL